MNTDNKPEDQPRGERKPTILDVARLADVAVGTVSRVLNGLPNVREDTRKRVLGAIVELGYVPDIVARSMRSNRSMLFACVMRDFTVPVLSMFVDSAQGAADRPASPESNHPRTAVQGCGRQLRPIVPGRKRRQRRRGDLAHLLALEAEGRRAQFRRV
jgi:hypothetical protein